MPAQHPRILLLTGESSGDRYGGLLASAVRRRHPQVHIAGLGGDHMRRAGVELLCDSSGIAVAGIVEVLSALREIRAAWRAARDELTRRRPDLVVLIDYAGFNLRFARHADRAGVPVLYFVSPQVWAWRAWRVRSIARHVRKMLVILPFEEAFYRQRGVTVQYVGHPLVDLVPAAVDRPAAAARLGLDPERPVLGLLPGSRRGEVQRLLPILRQAAGLVARQRPGLQCVLPLTAGIAPVDGGEGEPPCIVVRDDFQAAVGACHAALVASGTATLETALLGVPMVIAYRVSPLTYRLVRRLSNLQHAGLPNLILGEEVVPEFLEDDCRPEALAGAVLPLLDEGEPRRRMQGRLGELRARLGGGGAVERAADAVVDLLESG